MALRTILTFPYTLTLNTTETPLVVQKFTVDFDNAADRAAITPGSKIDVSGKGSGYVAAVNDTSTALRSQIWLVGWSGGTRWAASDTVRNNDDSDTGVATVVSDDKTDDGQHIGPYVSVINDDDTGAGGNAVLLVQDTKGNSSILPKNAVQATWEYTVSTDKSYDVAFRSTASDEIVITVVQEY